MTIAINALAPTGDKLADIEGFARALQGAHASEELPADLLTSETAHSVGAELHPDSQRQLMSGSLAGQLIAACSRGTYPCGARGVRRSSDQPLF